MLASSSAPRSTQILVDATTLAEPLHPSPERCALAAILFPAGYFLSSMGRERTAPNGLIVLLYAGAVSLGLGVVALGIGLLS